MQVPLVLDFHPMGLGLDWEQANSGYKSLSDQEGFITVWPQGLENTWNIGPCCTTSKTVDDDAFARAIVRQLSVEACIDPRRVYATGFSMGGAMAYYLACRQAEVFAAVASSSMDLLPEPALSCTPSRPITEISFRGDADTTVPYSGGSTSPPGHPEMAFDVLGAVGTFEKWASLDQCTGLPSSADINGCSTYSKCQGGVEVTLCTTPGGGQVVGDAKTAWAMLKKHPMP
jgi:polyhydroxybutyrate depolymerase